MLTRGGWSWRIPAAVVAALLAVACRGNAPADATTGATGPASAPAPTSAPTSEGSAGNRPSSSSGVSTAAGGDTAAAPAATRSDADRCANAQTQVELTACWGVVASDARKQADEAFLRVRSWATDRATVAERLARAEALWRQYRDAHCDAVTAVWEGGSAAPMQRAVCQAALDRQHAETLLTIMRDAAPQ